MMDINTTPLIDVMLVLLVMLIITIPIQLHSVNLNLPTGNPPPPLVKPEVLKIDIDSSGAIYWNGEVIPDRATLEEKFTVAAAQAVQPELHLRPDKAREIRRRRRGDGVGAAAGDDQDRHRRQRAVHRVAARTRTGRGRQQSESRRNGFRKAAERPDQARHRDHVRRRDARAAHLGAVDGARPQGRWR